MQIRKTLSSLALATVLLAQVQIGNIPAFDPLVQQSSAAGEQFTFNTAWEIRSFINSIPGITHIPDDSSPQSAAARFDDVTAAKICELKGFPTVVSKTSDYYRSCGDNQIAYWNGSDFTLIPSCQDNSFLWTLTCEKPVSSPVGYLDPAISNCDALQGWTCDADNFAQPLQVHLYDGPAEQGHILGSFTADVPREAQVGAQCGGNSNHGYRVPVTDAMNLKDGQTHQIYAYGINIGPAADNTHLTSSPFALTCQPPAAEPIGYIDHALSNCDALQGWTCDADNFAQPLQVHLYDGPAEQGHILGSFTADVPREAQVGAQCGGNSNHGYRVPVTDAMNLKDGQTHQIYAYGINIGGGVNNSLLSTSPFPLQCGSPQAAFTVTKTADRGTITAGGTINYTINATNAGQSAQSNVRITDPIPGNLIFTAGGSTAGCASQGSAVVCEAQTVNPGQTISATLRFQVGPNASCNQTIDNVAQVQKDNVTMFASNHAQTTVQCVTVTPQCRDGQDNDGDGKFDMQDPGCSSPDDNDEFNPAICQPGEVTHYPTVQFNRQRPFITGVFTQPQFVSFEGIPFRENSGDPVLAASNLTAGSTVTVHTEGTMIVGEGWPNYSTEGGNQAVLGYLKHQIVGQWTSDSNQVIGDGFRIGPDFTGTVPSGATRLYVAFTDEWYGDNVGGFGAQVNAQSCVIPPPPPVPQCRDGVDNDGDGLKDMQDPGCSSPEDNDETNVLNRPAGYLDPAITNCEFIQGWTCDADDFNQPLQVHLYNGPAEQGQILGSFTANVGREPQVGAQCGGNNNHGYKVAFPDSLRDGQPHQIYAYGINIGPTANNTHLTSSPVTLTCAPLQQPPNFTVVKTADVQSVQQGGIITYTIIAQNVGQTAQDDIRVVDLVPANLIFVPAGSTPSCSAQANGVMCAPQTFASGQSESYTLRFQVPPAMACGAGSPGLDNFADIQQHGTTFATSNHVTSSVTCAPPSFTLVKTADVQSVTAGGFITYTIIATNIGQTAQSDVRVIDTVPDSLVLTTAGTTPGCTTQGNAVLCPAQTFNPGQSQSFTLRFQVPANSQCGQNSAPLDNVASLQQSNVTFFTSNHVTSSVQCPAPEFTLTKSANTQAPVAGGTIIYTITAQNIGQAAQSDVRMIDTIPDSLVLIPSSSTTGCSTQGQTVVCQPETYAPGQSRTYTLAFQIPGTSACGIGSIPLDNVASIQQSGISLATSNHVTTSIQCSPPQFTATKSGPATTSLGGVVSYTVSVRNDGTTSQQTIRVIDPVPAGITFLSSPQGCSTQGGTVVCPAQTYGPGETKTFLLNFQAPSNLSSCNLIIDNQAQVQQGTTAFTATNHAQTRVDCPPVTADLSILKTGPSSVTRGGSATYSITVTNNGPATATNVQIHDDITSLVGLGFVYQSATGANCQPVNNGNEVACSIGSLTTGAPASVQLLFNVSNIQNCQNGMTATNRATVTGDTTDPVSTNNAHQINTIVNCPVDNTADLAIVKTGPSAVSRGGTITYGITLSNSGPAVAQNVAFDDTVPADLVFQTPAGASCSMTSATNLHCTVGNVSPGLPVPVSLVFSVPAIQNCTSSTQITNIVTATSSNTDPVSGNNISRADTTLNCPANDTADLTIQKVGPALVAFGGTITYSITATNNGPNAAQSIIIHDPVQPGLTFLSSSGGASCSEVSGEVRCTISSLSSGLSTSNISLTFTVGPAAQVCTGTSVTNTATIESATTDPVPANNSSAAMTSIVCPVQSADLSITKTGPTAVTRGNTITYGLTVTNNGPGTPANIIVTDPIPDAFTFNAVQSDAACSPSGATIVCTAALGLTSRTFNLTFNVPTLQSCTQSVNVTNTATVNSQFTDPVPGNNTSNTVTTAVNCPTVTTADLSITKTGPSTAVVRGNAVVYTVQVTNAGPAIANSVVVTDTFPGDMDYVNFSAPQGVSCALQGSTQVQCQLGQVQVSSPVSITLNFTAKTISSCSQSATVTNAVSVGTSSTDLIQGNNNANATTTLTCPAPTTPNLTVYKTDNRSTANVNETLHYSIILTNNSSVAANNVSVSDTVPYGLTILTVSDGGTIIGQSVSWNNITVGGSSSRTLTVDAQVRSDIGNGTVIRNTVYVSGQTSSDDTTINNQTNPNPPYYPPYTPPPYYPPHIQPPYYPPTNPPVYYPPTSNPPVYYPPVTLPITGTRDGSAFYSSRSDTSNVTDSTTPTDESVKAAEDASGSPDAGTVFIITMLTLLGVGSAAASKVFMGGL